MKRTCFATLSSIVVSSLLFTFGNSALAQNIAPAANYSELADRLTLVIQHEMKDKGIPDVAIALVDDQRIVWAQGFGWQDDARNIPATAHTVYRVGSVSKLFTDIGIMQLAERDQVNLDAPVQRYIPDFRPHNPFGEPVTLRELMMHRSGLAREPPVGNYFDDSGPSLQQTVRSLNNTTLVYAPGTQTKYSNAGVATVGYVLQTLERRPYAEYLQGSVLMPLGMTESSFEPEPRLMKNLATGYMWSYDGLHITTPNFQIGEGPCCALYTTVIDLGKFMSALFADGRGNNGEVLEPKTLHSMWDRQNDSRDLRYGLGIGFGVGRFDGQLLVGHDGAIYGFATQLEALPDAKLGVVVITALDSTNAVASHIAAEALHGMLAHRTGTSLPPLNFSRPLPATLASRLDGRYGSGANAVDLQDQSGEVYFAQLSGGAMVSLREKDNRIIRDGRLGYSPEPIMEDAKRAEPVLLWEGNTDPLTQIARPAAAPQAWMDLIGEYGWDYDKLYILERNGSLTALIEWFEFDPLKQLSTSAFEFSSTGLYAGERATFLRDDGGHVTAVRIGGVVFPRRHTNAAGEIFQIKPLKPVEELRRQALLAKPPAETGTFRTPDLVDVTKLDPTIHLDIRYATNRDFLGAPMYQEARAFLQKPAAEALAEVSKSLHKQGYGLLIHDAYRPWYVTKMFWDGTPDDKKIFVANPSEGSRHNRGCAVDLTLYDFTTGEPLGMTGGYDEMSERSYPFYPGGTSRQRWDRNTLRKAMEAAGFTVYTYEWWHFDFKDWQHYPILNQTFEQLDQQQTASTDPSAHDQTVTPAEGIAGSWFGAIEGEQSKLRLALTITKSDKGEYSGHIESIEQESVLPIDAIAPQGKTIRFTVNSVGGTYEGALNENGTEINGSWAQANVPSQPLSFAHNRDAPVQPERTGPKEKPLIVPLDVTVPLAPTAFKADGKMHLAYELHIVNMGSWNCTLKGIDVISGESSSRSLTSLAGANLEGMVMRPGVEVSEKAKLAPGSMAVVFMWVTSDHLENLPASIRHRLTVKIGDYPEELTVETAPLTVRSRPIVIGPPLRGDHWLAGNGPSSTSDHWRALQPLHGRAMISQRFAIDWVKLGDDGKTYHGDLLDNRNYYAYGSEALAVADGVVTEVKDGIPQNVPGASSRAVPITVETIGGNHVILKIGEGYYAFYAHLQPGSIRVKVGDKVRRGQVIGLVGNTGNSTEPHLHFHISNANSPLASEGLPYALRSFEVEGRGWTWKPSDEKSSPETHTTEIPLENEIVRFPSAH